MYKSKAVVAINNSLWIDNRLMFNYVAQPPARGKI
jgi:hypothetical protein